MIWTGWSPTEPSRFAPFFVLHCSSLHCKVIKENPLHSAVPLKEWNLFIGFLDAGQIKIHELFQFMTVLKDWSMSTIQRPGLRDFLSSILPLKKEQQSPPSSRVRFMFSSNSLRFSMTKLTLKVQNYLQFCYEVKYFPLKGWSKYKQVWLSCSALTWHPCETKGSELPNREVLANLVLVYLESSALNRDFVSLNLSRRSSPLFCLCPFLRKQGSDIRSIFSFPLHSVPVVVEEHLSLFFKHLNLNIWNN